MLETPPRPGALQEVAFIHGATSGSGRLKTLLLFFDGIAFLETRQEAMQSDETIALPLADLGVLHTFEAEKFVDESVARELSTAIAEAIQGGVLTPRTNQAIFDALVDQSRVGHVLAPDIAKHIVDELGSHDLAIPDERSEINGGYGFPVQEHVRDFIHAALTQLIRRPAEAQGLSLQPADEVYHEDQYGVARLLRDTQYPNLGQIVSLDLTQVTFDLDDIPLDEVLDFKRQHGAAHRRYAKDLRQFGLELSLTPPSQMDKAMDDRRQQLADAADGLRRFARESWRRPVASFGLGISGAAMAWSQGNPVGAGISALGGILGLKRQAEPGSAFTYLFAAQRKLSR